MSKPVVYVHRVQYCPYDLYMNAENESRLQQFAEVINHGNREEPVPPQEMASVLAGCAGVLSLNGSFCAEVTGKALREAGTVQAVAIAHYWGEMHRSMIPVWQDAGLEVLDASYPCNEAVAEWALGAIIAGLRRFEDYDRRLKAGEEWPDFRAAGQLNGSTVGLVALGHVGRIAARYLKPFDCRVLACDPAVDEAEAAELGVELVDMDALLRESDAVSLHAPVLDTTRGMIGERELGLMKDGALLVNSARMALLDGEALRRELQDGRLRAYLDVFEQEPLPKDDLLRSLDNVVLTPHIAGTTTKMFLRCGRAAIDALHDYFARHDTVA